MEQGTLVSEVIQGMELAKQLRFHLGSSSSSSVESRDFLVQRILPSYEKALLILKLNAPLEHSQQNAGAIIFMLPESPVIINGSPKNDDVEKDYQEIRDASKKRKMMPTWTDQVRVSTENLMEGPHDDGYNWRKYGQKDILGDILLNIVSKRIYAHLAPNYSHSPTLILQLSFSFKFIPKY